jgi:hypothetical protein
MSRPPRSTASLAIRWLELLLGLAEKENRWWSCVSHDNRWLPLCHRKVVLQNGSLIGDDNVRRTYGPIFGCRDSTNKGDAMNAKLWIQPKDARDGLANARLNTSRPVAASVVTLLPDARVGFIFAPGGQRSRGASATNRYSCHPGPTARPDIRANWHRLCAGRARTQRRRK